MNIGIDISALGEPNFTGVGVYVNNLVKNLAEIDSENEYHLCYRLSRYKKRRIESPVNRPNFHFKIIQEPFNFLFQRKLDVFHGPAERLPNFPHPKKVVTIHDMAVIKGEGFWTDEFRDMVKIRYNELIIKGKADAIITVSESSKKDIVEYFGIEESRVKVVYEGVDASFRPLPKDEVSRALLRHGVTEPYFLNVGALQERKNIVRILEAFKGYLNEGGDHILILCGKPAYGHERIDKTIADLKLEEKVKILGHLPHDDLVAFYCGATLFCFPSLFEGFGLPILEAFACGCPVITSNVTSMPEVAGDAAVIVNPYKSEEIKEAMLKLSSFGRERDELIKKGVERASEFSWKNTAKGVLETYNSLI